MKPETVETWVVCRICLQQETFMMDIFNIRDGQGCLSEMLQECGGIPIEEGDNYPDKICGRCLRLARSAYKFRRTCQKSHDHITELLATSPALISAEDYIAEEKLNPASVNEVLHVFDDDNNIIEDDESIKIEMCEQPASPTVPSTDIEYKIVDTSQCTPDSYQYIDDANCAVDEEEVNENDFYEPEYAEYEIVEEKIEQQIIDDEDTTHDFASIDDDIGQDVLTSDDEYVPNGKTVTRSQRSTTRISHRNCNTTSTIVKRGKRKPKDTTLTYICDVCGNIYPTQARLTEHMKFHSGVKPHKCEICGRGFVQNQQLVRHMNTHTGKRPYKCNYCPAAFADRSTKTKHHRIHTKERPYECDVCHKTFTYSDNLKFHKMIHTGEKPHVCDYCGKGFTKAYKMRLHRQTHEKRGLIPPTNVVKTEIITGQ